MTAPELVAQVKRLTPASHVTVRLIGMLNTPTVDSEDVVGVLKSDSVLTASLLRACNSSALGLKQRVSSVDHAVLLLGYQEILRLVLSLGLSGSMNAPLPGYAIEAKELWRQSLSTAIAAEVLVSSGLDLPVEAAVAFTVGLLHDFGKTVFHQVLSAEVQAKIRNQIQLEGRSRSEAEKQVLGTDHAEVGACLLGEWRLHQAIVEAVANHHHPVWKQQFGLSVVAHLADCLAHLAGSAPGYDAYAVRVADGVAEAFGVTPDRLESMVAEVRIASERVEQLMAIT